MKTNTLCLNLIHIKDNVSSNLAEILFILRTTLAHTVQSIIGSCTGDGDLWPQGGIAVYCSIGDVAERCGINPATPWAWQRRYGLLELRHSEGGHWLFGKEDIQCIGEIKRWISNGAPVGKVEASLETTNQDTKDDWSRLQEKTMSILRMANSTKLRARTISLGREYPVDQLTNHIYLPARQRFTLDYNASRIMSSMFNGILIECAATSFFEMRRKPGKEATLMARNVEERAWLRLKAWRLSLSGWHISVLADPIESPRPGLFLTQTLIVWTGMVPTRRQNEFL